MKKAIKMIDLTAEYQQLKPQLGQVIKKVWSNGHYINGPEVTLFENKLAEYLSVKNVIGCGNGTDALQIALMAIGLKPGDEVIIPAFAYVSVIEVVCLLGGIPVLVDIEDQYFQIDSSKIEEAITPLTKAIIPVHLFGQSGDLQKIIAIANKHQIFVIEDNAQALGAKLIIDGKEKMLGTLGHIGCTSFFPTKNLGGFGDGGALFTNDDELAHQIRRISNHGQQNKYEHDIIGINSRLDSLQAAILNFKLQYLDQNLSLKRSIAAKYIQELSSCKKIRIPSKNPDGIHTWHQFTIKVKMGKRNELKDFLKNRGIETMIYYPKSLHQQKAYTNFRVFSPISDRICDSVLSLPIHSLLKLEEVSFISHTIKDFFNAKH
ncbi:MAG: DegT/DnrJ/EryC1/StrS family aminotransferase [Bacteroidetes bacterium]|nr:DegT/DnrJ/EryC1/StrS family aminotransferase [Bacteroidota bacterium]MBU1483783.1 DegT/DnrJ/EryC1/StrS family aminotransferase [Bacteroidota bacterium]MBU2266745.1 DegT/DnrJ/EryC1/StrS family aminotransferase [Bacteroidota bacterium]MBU2374644.1 DegT/DnrJ/EryC1/StrS family aminotransferase [Bacteroidota bacterium]